MTPEWFGPLVHGTPSQRRIPERSEIIATINHAGRDPDPDVERESIQAESKPPPAKWDAWPKASELVDTMGDSGARVPTRIEPLDKGWRGGLHMGKRYAVLGAPSAGKTTFCVQLAVTLAKQGCFVVYIAGDEPRDAILVRIGQHLGYSRDSLERGFPDALLALRVRLDEIGIVILDPDAEDDVDINTVTEFIVTKAGERPAVLFVDSLQTTASALKTPGGAQNPKANVDAILAGAKVAARRYQIAVVLLCEMSRGAYRASSGPQAVSDMAAGKESGGIEYAVDAQIVMRPTDEGRTHVSLPKSRMGKVEEFDLELNHQFALFTVASSNVPAVGTFEDRAAEKFKKLCENVLLQTSREPGTNATIIAEQLQARASSVRAALEHLGRIGKVTNRGNSRKDTQWHAV